MDGAHGTRCSIFLSAEKKKVHYCFTCHCALNNKDMKERVHFLSPLVMSFLLKFIFILSLMYLFFSSICIHSLTYSFMHLLNKCSLSVPHLPCIILGAEWFSAVNEIHKNPGPQSVQSKEGSGNRQRESTKKISEHKWRNNKLHK